VISLVELGKRYRVGELEVAALAGVHLSIGAGELVVILGPSGSGKTTLLNLVGALDTASDGELVVAGTDLRKASRPQRTEFRRTGVAFIFQNFNLFPGLTAAENVQFGAEVSGRPGARERAARALADVGLAGRADHFPHQLSGGEQQRVAVARALATGNPIILADEPTGELDVATGITILAMLRANADAGRTVLVVTHNREIARVADRVVELSGGRVLSAEAPPGGPVPVESIRW
jgi:putative ABC transport system ATP-binding protein